MAPRDTGSIAFAWSGLPDYAARCIRAVIDRFPGTVTVIGTRPSVPIAGMERSLGQAVHWIDGRDADADWTRLGLTRPDLFFQGGFHWPAFNSLGVRCRSGGGKVILQTDSNWQGTLRQHLLDPIRHRALLRRRFDGVFVPGIAGTKYAERMGYRSSTVLEGMYGADPVLFNGGASLNSRPKRFLFVGRLVQVKFVVALAKAFVDFAADNSEWSLQICGAGPLREQLPCHPRLDVSDFLQPAQLADVFRNARCLVLPSLYEPWGLVAHEAVLSGCALALSQVVGSAQDLATKSNSVLFRPGDVNAITDALRSIASWDTHHWQEAENASRSVATKFGPGPFADAVARFVDKMHSEM
ncbi:glycosyltransferase [Mesorhizobium sp. LMG 17147]|uniref:glycosyltransferase n=1 Tax=Mesorhizobium sp. LMG 17147 TaxID=2963091 RepID=UPI0020C9618C|nr:glycosyltransferase [Mesorhizobium sp. LMG 17147]MCP9234079.1 glycosyltransferase [Mesorhizobium sp. LMG 17147]